MPRDIPAPDAAWNCGNGEAGASLFSPHALQKSVSFRQHSDTRARGLNPYRLPEFAHRGACAMRVLPPFGDNMRHLFLPTCICLMTLSGAAGADGISSEQFSGAKAEDNNVAAQVTEAPGSPEQDENAPPKAADASENPPAAETVVPLPIRRPPPVKHLVVARSRHEICSSVIGAAHSNDLPIPFFIHLLFQESGFKPDVVSRAGAQGIAQFMPETAATVGLRNPFDPIQAIAASGRLLGDLVRQFGNLGLAAAAYNAGPRRIQDWIDKKGKLPDETQHYVKTITGRPAETWKGHTVGRLSSELPREAPCQDAAILVASNAAGRPARGIKLRAPSVQTAAVREKPARLAKEKTPTIMVAEHASGKHDKRSGGTGTGSNKGGKGAIQLAASSKKKDRKGKPPRH